MYSRSCIRKVIACLFTNRAYFVYEWRVFQKVDWFFLLEFGIYLHSVQCPNLISLYKSHLLWSLRPTRLNYAQPEFKLIYMYILSLFQGSFAQDQSSWTFQQAYVNYYIFVKCDTPQVYRIIFQQNDISTVDQPEPGCF